MDNSIRSKNAQVREDEPVDNSAFGGEWPREPRSASVIDHGEAVRSPAPAVLLAVCSGVVAQCFEELAHSSRFDLLL